MNPKTLTFKLRYSNAELRSAAAARRESLIREAAYRRAEQRGFKAGHELADWLDAEKEVERYLYG